MSTLYRSNSPHIRVVLLACALQSACTLALAQPAAPEIQLLVANSGNANLPSALRFDADSGSPRGPLGPPAAKLPGRGAVGIDQPRGVAADAAGNVVVGYRCANCGPDKRSAVFRFDMKTGGAGVTDFIAAAGLDEGFEGLALSPDGKVLVATQAELGLVNHYDGNSGQLLHSFTTVAVPRGATIGPDGKAYVLIHGNRLAAVHRYDLALGTDAGPFVAAGAGGLDTDGGSAGLVFGPNGDLFVTSTGRDQILRYNGINGSFMGVFANPVDDDCAQPVDVAFGPLDGHLYVSCSGNDRIVRYDVSSGRFKDTFVVDKLGLLNGPTYMAFSRVDYPEVPRILSPRPDGTVDSRVSVFRWSPSADSRVASYQVSFAEDPEFLQTIGIPATTTSTQVAIRDFADLPENEERILFARVQGLNASGQPIIGTAGFFVLLATFPQDGSGFTVLRGLVQSNLNQGGITGATVSIVSNHTTGIGPSQAVTVFNGKFNGEYFLLALTTDQDGTPLPGPILVEVTGNGIQPTTVQFLEQNKIGGTIVQNIGVNPATIADPGRMTTEARRAWVDTGPRALHRFFRIRGNTPARVLIHGQGPSLNLPGASLVDPRLKVFDGNVLVASNNDWINAGNANQIAALGRAPGDAREPAILTTLPAGRLYHIIFDDRDGVVGWGQLSVVELDPGPTPRVIEISSRAQVASGGRLLLGWVDITGNTAKRVLVRGRGPSINVPFPKLQDPSLEVYQGETLIASNDNWGSSASVAEVANSGRAPRDPREPALALSLNPGQYMLVLRGQAAEAGIGILEAFELPN